MSNNCEYPPLLYVKADGRDGNSDRKERDEADEL